MDNARQKVLDILDDMHVLYDIIEHSAVYTIEEMDNLCIDTDNEVVKNLFVRDDKKKRYFIIVLCKNKRVNLKELSTKLNCRPLSFASEDDLYSLLGLNKGAVTPLGILNDRDCRVEVMFDKDIQSFKRVGVHPNDNTATVWINSRDLVDVIKKHGNEFSYIEI